MVKFLIGAALVAGLGCAYMLAYSMNNESEGGSCCDGCPGGICDGCEPKEK